MPGVPGIRSETHRNFPDLQVERDFISLRLRGFQRVQIQRCAERWMPCKWQFGRDRKDSYFFSLPSFSRSVPWKNESGFRKIHLARQRLHLSVIQSVSVVENRKRITRERRLREYIKLDEVVRAPGHKGLVHTYRRTCKDNDLFRAQLA